MVVYNDFLLLYIVGSYFLFCAYFMKKWTDGGVFAALFQAHLLSMVLYYPSLGPW